MEVVHVTEQTKHIVYYHDPCSDGIVGAWCACNTLRTAALYVGISPDKKISIESVTKEQDIYFIDVLPTREIESLCQKANRVIIMDHHKTNGTYLAFIQRLPNLEIHFDLTRSGCQIAWDYFNPKKERPWFVDYVADRDLWTWKLPESRAINLGLMTMGYLDSIPKVHALAMRMDLNTVMTVIHRYGTFLTSYKMKLLDKQVAQAKPMWLAAPGFVPLKCMVLECNMSLRSELGEAILKTSKIDGTPANIAVVFHRNPDETWRVSLRSTLAYDVSRIAALLGGGGHAQAAGFTIRPPQTFDQFFKPIDAYKTKTKT